MKYKRLSKLPYPHVIERRYRVVLLGLVRSTKGDIEKYIVPLLSDLPGITRKDDALDDFERIIQQIKDSAELNALKTIQQMRAIAGTLSDFTLGAIRRSLGGKIDITAEAKAVDIFSPFVNSDIDLLLKSWIYTNTRLIKSIPEKLLDDVAITVEQATRGGSSVTDLTKEIETKFNVSRNRAKLIARDQIAKLNGNIAKLEYKRVGIDSYEWVTSDDERVRKSHKVLNNKICTWDNPTIYKNSLETSAWHSRKSIGGVEKDVCEDFQCRCTPIPILAY